MINACKYLLIFADIYFSVFSVKDGVFRQYRGARDKDSFITYVEEKKWTSVEAVSDWKSPDSLQMSLVSHFFKLSMLLRSFLKIFLTSLQGLDFFVRKIGIEKSVVNSNFTMLLFSQLLQGISWQSWISNVSQKAV